MKTTLFRGALACALLTSTALTAPALAQTAPPVAHNIDANGVDLVLGTFNLRQRLLSIGPNGENGLDYVRMLNEGRWLDNVTGGVFQSGNQVSVSLGDTSATFTFSGGSHLFNAGTYSPKRADGSTLTRSGGTFTYTNAAGIVIRFTASMVSPGQIVEGTGRLVDLRYPSGMLVNFNYRTESICEEEPNCTSYSRLQSVTNSANYQLHFTYSQNTIASVEDYAAWTALVSVQAINTAVEACDGYADHCTLTNAWPAVTFGSSGADETATLPGGGVWRFTPSGLGPGAIRRPGSTSDDVSIAYDSLGRVTSLTGIAGTWTYGYSDSGSTRTTSVSGPLSGARTIVSDLEQLTILSDQDALERTTSYQYDGSARVTRITAPEGNHAAYTYDGRGNVTQTELVPKSGSGASPIIVTASFPSSCANALTCNRPTSATDARGNTTDYTYDSSHGGVSTVTPPAPTSGATRPQTRFSYAQVTAVTGQPVYLPTGISACQTTSSCSGGSDESKATIAYNSSNLLATSVSRGNGSGTLTVTSALTYDDIGNLQTVDGPLSGSADTTRFRYNAMRQPVGAVGPDPDGSGGNPHPAQRSVYDSAGLRIASDAGTVNSQSDSDWAGFATLRSATTARDPLGRPVAERLVSGSTIHALTQTSYDAAGRVQCMAQRMNPSEFGSSSLPSDACTLDTQGSFGPDRISRATYDAAGQVTVMQTAYGVAGVEASETSATYHPNGTVRTLADGNNNITYFHYDGFDRLEYRVMPSRTTSGEWDWSDWEGYSYDPNGNMIWRALREGSGITYGYDALNRLTVKDVPARGDLTAAQTRDVHYAHDLLGRLTAARFDSATGEGVTFAYDALGRPSSSGIDMGGVTRTLAYGHDAAGNRNALTWPDSVSFGVDHDVLGRPSLLGGGIAYIGYGDNGASNGISRANGIMTWFGNDGAQRLSSLRHFPDATGDVTATFAYNPASQISAMTRDNDNYAFAQANGSTAYTIDGLNQVTQAGSATVTHDDNGNVDAIGSTSYLYDHENRLVGAGAATLAYDPLGRLFSLTSGSTTTTFLQDGDNLVAEYDGATMLRRHVHWPAVDTPAVTFEGADLSQPYWLHADERGTIVARSDGNAAPTINRYDEYGAPQGTPAGRFGYTGQAWLPEIGLYYYRARIYSPTLGRFMQTDPIGYGGGMNMYAYVGNDPVNFTDPLGLDPPIIVTAQTCRACGTPIAEVAGQLGFGAAAAMIAGPTVSENSAADILITGAQRPRAFFSQSVCCGGGGGAGGDYEVDRDRDGSQDDDGERGEPTIVVVGHRGRGIAGFGASLVVAKPNAIFFGYPPEANASWHVNRHLQHLTLRQMRLLKQQIGRALRAGSPSLKPGQAVVGTTRFMGRDYVYKAYGLSNGVTNVGTVF